MVFEIFSTNVQVNYSSKFPFVFSTTDWALWYGEWKFVYNKKVEVSLAIIIVFPMEERQI